MADKIHNDIIFNNIMFNNTKVNSNNVALKINQSRRHRNREIIPSRSKSRQAVVERLRLKLKNKDSKSPYIDEKYVHYVNTSS